MWLFIVQFWFIFKEECAAFFIIEMETEEVTKQWDSIQDQQSVTVGQEMCHSHRSLQHKGEKYHY